MPNVLLACVSVRHLHVWCSWKQEKSIGSPGTGCELSCWYWEPNPNALSAEPSFQSLWDFLKKKLFLCCVHMMCMYMMFMWVCVSWCSCGGQRTAFYGLGSLFSPLWVHTQLFRSTWQVPLPQSHLTGLIVLAWFSFLFSSSAWV